MQTKIQFCIAYPYLNIKDVRSSFKNIFMYAFSLEAFGVCCHSRVKSDCYVGVDALLLIYPYSFIFSFAYEDKPGTQTVPQSFSIHGNTLSHLS